jgi:NAD(P)H-flavin reductase
MTEREKLFEIELDNGHPLNHSPGQFVELSVPGVGEAPISITSSPSKKGNSFELCVRNIGNVTQVLHHMQMNEKIGIRGPYGTGFPVEALRGQDLVFIAGGLGVAPLRSLMKYVFDNRNIFGEVTILYGCKEPCELLFSEEIEAWQQRDDITYIGTVDRCPDGVCWEGNIGLITTLIPEINMNIANTYVAIAGPAIMYKFVLLELERKKVPADKIFLSLERRMKCGVGKCGHCQINGRAGEYYVCQDGPVFNYKDVKGFEEAL